MIRTDARTISATGIRRGVLRWTFRQFVTDTAGRRVFCYGCSDEQSHPHFATRRIHRWLWPRSPA